MSIRFVNNTSADIDLIIDSMSYRIQGNNSFDFTPINNNLRIELFVNKASTRALYKLNLNCKSTYEIKQTTENSLIVINEFNVDNGQCVKYSGLSIKSNDIDIITERYKVLDEEIIRPNAEKFDKFDKKAGKALDTFSIIKRVIEFIIVLGFTFWLTVRKTDVITAFYVVGILVAIAGGVALILRFVVKIANDKLDKKLGIDSANSSPRNINQCFDEEYISKLIRETI